MIIIMLRNVSDINNIKVLYLLISFFSIKTIWIWYINLYESVENFESITTNQIVNIMQIFRSKLEQKNNSLFTSEIQYSVVSYLFEPLL